MIDFRSRSFEEVPRRIVHAFVLLALTLILAGCARTPSGLTNSLATRLTFRFTLNAPINPNYIYCVAIRVLNPPVGTASELSDPTQGPSPIVAVGSKNGVVGGWPTHYVLYTGIEPTPYEVFRFPHASELPDPTDPTAPLNLTMPGYDLGPVIVGSAVDPAPTSPGGAYGNVLGFDIDTSYLDQFANGPGSIQTIQFNILTMNVQGLTQSEISSRVMDAIGNQSNVGNATFVNPITVNVQTSGQYTDVTSGVTEMANDTFGGILPPVDLVGWSLTVTTP